MWAVYLRTLNTRKWSLLVTLGITVIFVLLYTSMYPEIKDNAAELAVAFEAYPESMTKALGINIKDIFTNFEYFIAAEHYSIMWPIMMLVLAIPAGVGVVAKEVDKGTMGLLLSLPITRAQLFIAKYLAGATQVLLFVATSVWVTYPIARLFDLTISVDGHLVLMWLCLLFGMGIFTLATLVSTVMSNSSKASGILSGIAIVMYALKIFANLNDDYEFLQYGSFFYYFDFNAAILDLKIAITNVWAFVWVITITTAMSFAIFLKRDFSV